MISFPHAIAILEDEKLLSVPRQHIKDAPLYVRHNGSQEILMPSREAWRNFKISDEFQRILPAPITKTIQTSDGLRGHRIYSILLSDGDNLGAIKLLASDNGLIAMVQAYDIAATLKGVMDEGQPLQVQNRCYCLRPTRKGIPDNDRLFTELGRIFSVSTMHFIYSVHLDRECYQIKST